MINLKRKLLSGTLAGLMSLGLVAAAAQPAQAGYTVYGCDVGLLCLFDGTYFGQYSWAKWSIRSLHDNYTCLNTTFNNVASSGVVNPEDVMITQQYSWQVRMWPNANCTGTPLMWHNVVSGPQSDADFRDGAFHATDNRSNTITSIQVVD